MIIKQEKKKGKIKMNSFTVELYQNNCNFRNDTELLKFLIKRLPKKIRAFKEKKFSSNITLNTIYALKSCRWIEYNQGWVNMLLFDLDYKITVEEAFLECIFKINHKPTFVLETDKGVHIAYALKNIIKYDWEKTIRLARYVKEAITELLKADKFGSLKIKGIWRNPLLHKNIFIKNLYNLEDFKHLITERKHYIINDINITTTKINKNNFSFKLGNRNNYIFYNAMKEIKEADYTKIYNYIYNLNIKESIKNNVEKLEDRELQKIAKSVLRYNLNNKNYVGKIKKEINRGVMKFEKIKNLNKKEYEKEVKRRQRLSAHRTNKILKEKRIEIMTQRKKKTKQKIKEAIETLKTLDEKITITKIAKETNLSRQTISKYLKELKEEANT